MKIISPEAHLAIRGYTLALYLGWPDEERAQKQNVSLDIDILFPEPPRACQTDHLDDTLCYAALTDSLQQNTATKKYRLVEHAAHDIYHLIKPFLPPASLLKVHLSKRPAIPGLTGDIRFSFGDALS